MQKLPNKRIKCNIGIGLARSAIPTWWIVICESSTTTTARTWSLRPALRPATVSLSSGLYRKVRRSETEWSTKIHNRNQVHCCSFSWFSPPFFSKCIKPIFVKFSVFVHYLHPTLLTKKSWNTFVTRAIKLAKTSDHLSNTRRGWSLAGRLRLSAKFSSPSAAVLEMAERVLVDHLTL